MINKKWLLVLKSDDWIHTLQNSQEVAIRSTSFYCNVIKYLSIVFPPAKSDCKQDWQSLSESRHQSCDKLIWIQQRRHPFSLHISPILSYCPWVDYLQKRKSKDYMAVIAKTSTWQWCLDSSISYIGFLLPRKYNYASKRKLM